MASTQIAQNLAFVNWTVLTALAVGSYAAVFMLRRRTSATSGYLGFTATCALVFGLLAWLSDGALPMALVDSPVADGRHSVILPQVTFGIAVRMAVMGILAGN